MVSGHYVGPSLTQGLSKLLQGYSSGRLEQLAQESQAKDQSDFLRAAGRQAPTAGPAIPREQMLQRLAEGGNPMAAQLRTQQVMQSMQPKPELISGQDAQALGFGQDTVLQRGADGEIKVLQKPEKPRGPLVQNVVNPAGQANSAQGENFFKKLDERSAEQFIKNSERGLVARTKLNQIERLDSLLEQSGSGIGAAAKLLASDFGLEIGDNVSELQAARALINKIVPEQRPEGSGEMSNADLDLFKQSLQRIINQPGGNQLISQTLKGIALYEQQIGDIADQVIARKITPEQGREMQKQVKNPLAFLSKPKSNAPEGVPQKQWDLMTPTQQEEFIRLGGEQ
jgi:hypothetical protein